MQGHKPPFLAQADFHYLLQFFSYGHLPPQLAEVSKPFYEMAYLLNDMLPMNPETTTALRKLLEAKDCAVRAKLYKKDFA